MGFLAPKMPKMPEPKEPTPPPSIDEAKANADQANRLRKRKGRKDYIFAGRNDGASNVGTKKLTGE